jgi:hypothetical protein
VKVEAGYHFPISLLPSWLVLSDAVWAAARSPHPDPFLVVQIPKRCFHGHCFLHLPDSYHPLANTLEECATVLNMERVAPPLGGVTHRPYNAALRGSVLDLVFVPIYRAYTGYPTLGDKGEPDHLPLLLDIPLKVFWPAGKKSIAPVTYTSALQARRYRVFCSVTDSPQY